MSVIIADIVKIMEKIAPSALAEQWDNVGLQVGQNDWPVRSICVALDPLPDVVAGACEKDIDLLITHHPLLFQPVKSIDFSSPVGEIIRLAVFHNLGIFSAHTNLDKARGGVNDVLADKLGLQNCKILETHEKAETFKLVTFVPVEYEEKVLNSLLEAPIGEIGSYTCCSFRHYGKGTFKPGLSSVPFIGDTAEVSHVDEVRIETVVKKSDLSCIVDTIRKNHPYETMAYDVYPLFNPENNVGFGRIGDLEEPMAFGPFARMVKERLNLSSVKIAGNTDRPVNKVAVCAGSGSGLVKEFLSSEAQVFISGDLRYHDARTVEEVGKGLVDLGHFASEHLIVGMLAERLRKSLYDNGMNIKVEPCGLDTDPFRII